MLCRLGRTPSARAPDQVDEIIDVGLRTRGTAQGGRVQALRKRVATAENARGRGRAATSATARLERHSCSTSRFELKGGRRAVDAPECGDLLILLILRKKDVQNRSISSISSISEVLLLQLLILRPVHP